MLRVGSQGRAVAHEGVASGVAGEPRKRTRMPTNRLRVCSPADGMPSRTACDAPADANGRCDQPIRQCASCERCESRSGPFVLGRERRRTGDAARSRGSALGMRSSALERKRTRDASALERRGTREGARPRGSVLARWRAREATAPGAVPRVRGTPGAPGVRFLSAPERLKIFLK